MNFTPWKGVCGGALNRFRRNYYLVLRVRITVGRQIRAKCRRDGIRVNRCVLVLGRAAPVMRLASVFPVVPSRTKTGTLACNRIPKGYKNSRIYCIMDRFLPSYPAEAVLNSRSPLGRGIIRSRCRYTTSTHILFLMIIHFITTLAAYDDSGTRYRGGIGFHSVYDAVRRICLAV